MLTADFDYALHPDRIAQSPANPRDSCKLLVYHRGSGEIEHCVFCDVVDYLNPGDVLIVNDSKVIPARLFGNKKTGGKVEVLLLHESRIKNHELRSRAKSVWYCLTKPGLKAGDEVIFESARGTVVRRENEQAMIEFFTDGAEFFFVLEKIGHTPLPPYIAPGQSTPADYQTVYAKDAGSAAAPTAGLHFTPELLERIKAKGVQIAAVTLHVGLGTFQPITAENIEDHQIHSEYATISAETQDVIATAKRNGSRVIAVGTTATRTLEGLMGNDGYNRANDKILNPISGWVKIYITPGYQFRVVDALITNFHLPKSSLLVLLHAFVGSDWRRIYANAITREYRFYSFGDAMLVV